MIIIQEVIQVYILREVHYGVLLIKDVHDGRMDVQFWVAYMWTSAIHIILEVLYILRLAFPHTIL